MGQSKYVVVNYDECQVDKCHKSSAIDGCQATKECPKGILIQEEPGEPPMLKSPRMCVGCGKCISGCLYSAIDKNLS